jgi:hypothetical protein
MDRLGLEFLNQIIDRLAMHGSVVPLPGGVDSRALRWGE